MSESKTKSRTFRKTSKKTPGNRNVDHYTKRSPGKAICGNCGVVLAGVQSPSGKSSKSQRRPERPFGGVLCSRCSRIRIKLKARAVQ